jgi:Fe-S-cluster containining protein
MSSNFKFSCHSELGCHNDCCREADIFLTPYDMLRMKNALGIDSGEFLKKYTGMILDDVGPPVFFLEMENDGKKSCHFLGEEGCEIYEERPGRCRAFPLEAVGAGNYKLADGFKCLGIEEGEEYTLKSWKKHQGIDAYNEMDDLFKEITLDKKLIKKDMHDPNLLQMFFMVFDLDKFKRFIFESKFLDVFDVGRDEIKRMKESEAELLKFAINWLKFGLIDKEALKVKDSVLQDQKE